MFESHEASPATQRQPLPLSEIDRALTAQLAVAWAGERGDPKRLDWWRSDLVSEYGGEDLFMRLLPSTYRWAVLEAAREAALRKDAELRHLDPDPDHIVSLYCLGFALDERITERLMDLKRAAAKPEQALPSLTEVVERKWNRDRFFEWVGSHGPAETTPTTIGRRVKGPVPVSLEQQVSRLISALAPPANNYPLPHFRRSG